MSNSQIQSIESVDNQKPSREPLAEHTAPTKQDYKTLLRKKILIGSCYLKQAKTPERLAALKADLNDYLKRDSDRALFDLPSPH